MTRSKSPRHVAVTGKPENTFKHRVLDLPTYTPSRMLAKLNEQLFGDRDDINCDDTAAVIGVSHSTYSMVTSRIIMIPPKMVLNILDITGWSLEYFRSICGLPPYMRSNEHIEELSSWHRRLVESVRPVDGAADGQKDKYPAVRSGTDRRAMAVGRRLSGVEQPDRYHTRERIVD